MSQYKHIFTPVKIGKMTVKNRIETAPAMPFLATIDGDASRELIEWEMAFARGGVGIVTIGDSPIISEIATRVGHILNLGSDKTVASLNRLAEAIQRYGAKASIELTYFEPGVQKLPAEVTQVEIKSIIGSYVNAAYRCLNGGMDMIMIHGAHGHFISQFFSPRKNLRTDAYGGPFQNRARLVTEILEAIRDKVGDNLAIEYRISADELTPGGLTLEEQLEFAKLIQDRIDLLHISAGNAFTPDVSQLMIQPAYVPRGINIHFAERFKKELKIPVTALGSIDIAMAEQIIAENKADMVAMNRALIADPDCVNKARQGKPDRIRPCIRCNTCIQRTHRYFIPLRCTVNPLSGREAEFTNRLKPDKKKKVVVVGGGPAGMEAARRAAGRDHEVVLFEKDAELGGSLIMASAVSFKADMQEYMEWSVRVTMDTPNLNVKLSTEATSESIKAEKPEAIIIAIGSVPFMPDISGANRKNVVWAGDVLLGKVKIGDKLVVAGAGLTGSETAMHLAQQGRKITLIDVLSLERIGSNYPFTDMVTVWNMLKKLDVDIRTEVSLETITDTGVVIIDKKQKKTEISCDTVVLSLGVRPRTEAVRAFMELAPEVTVIGDCNNQRGNLYSATSEGFFAAMEI